MLASSTPAMAPGVTKRLWKFDKFVYRSVGAVSWLTDRLIK
jgi:hypothetical protein